MIFLQPHPRISLVFDDWFSLGVALVLVIGFILWMTIMFVTQRKLVKRVSDAITHDQLTEAFAAFRREIKTGQ